MNGSPHLSLRQREAVDRAQRLSITSYDVDLDLAGDEKTFSSRTTIEFESTGGSTFVDLAPLRINQIRLNGVDLDPDDLTRGRFVIETQAGRNELFVDAVMGFRNDGEGLHRSVDPADGRHYVYAMSFLDAAPSIFACFDQPDLKAAYTLHVRAPHDWTVIANAPGEQVESGVWEFQTTPPISTYLVTLVAGPWHVIRDHHDGIPLGLSARASMAGALEADAAEILTLTRQCFDEFHRLFDERYPFGNYHQAFVPEFNAGAMENPGCVTLRDQLVFTSKVTRGARSVRATTIAHEMAHQWFGNITTPTWWDDLWLNESFAEFMGNRVTADVTEFDDAWVHNAYQRRQWGLLADAGPASHPVAGNGAEDAATALEDFDGISYVKGSSVLKQLNARLGDATFFAGVNQHFARHRFANATMHDLIDSWERAGAGDLSDVTHGWLRSTGVDRITLDRPQGLLRRTPPAGSSVERRHAFTVAIGGADGTWRHEQVDFTGATTPLVVRADDAVVLDVEETSWLLAELDRPTLDRLPELAATHGDDVLRAAIWNNLRTTFEIGATTPQDVLSWAVASLPHETSDEPLSFNSRATHPTTMLLTEWLVTKVAPLAADPIAARRALHEVYLAKVSSAEPGGTVQHAAFQAAIETSTSPSQLNGWLGDQPPAGVDLDLAVRWRILTALASLGAIDRAGLDRHLADEPTAVSTVDHARAVASLPTPEAKQWAWDRFTGVADVANYELQAAGQGMWRPGHELLTEPYVERFFAELPALSARRSGWLVADTANWFFPITSLTGATVARAEALAADADLDPAVRRQMAVMADELRRRIAVRSTA